MTDSLVELRYLSVQANNIIPYFILKYSDRRTDRYLAGHHIHFFIQFISSLPSKKFLDCF